MLTNQNLKSLFEARTELESEIAAARSAVETELGPKKEKLDGINADILAISIPLADAAYKRAEKVSGTVKFAAGDAIFKSAIDKRVDYDGDALLTIAAGMPWPEAQKIFQFKASIGEKIYNALEDGPVKTAITAARTVKYGAPKITQED